MLIEAVGHERILLGFSGAGGTREGHLVRYHILPARQQSTTLGEPDGRRTPRLEELAAMLREAGFPVAISNDVDAWLKTHVVWTCAAAHAIYMVGGSNYALARTRDAVLLWIRAVREGYRALARLGVRVTPSNLLAFALVPEPLFAALLWRLMNSATADLVVTRHANAARAEYVQLGEEFLRLTRRAGVPTPAFDRLRLYVDPGVPSIVEGSGTLRPDWIELVPILGTLGVLGLGALGLARRRRLRQRGQGSDRL